MAKINDLASLIADELGKYTDEVTEKVKKIIDDVSDEVNEEIKKKIPFTERTHKYVKSFRIKTVFENKYNKRNIWHVVNGEYSLTHLLENGHVKRNGGRVKAYPHVIYGEQLANKQLTERIERAVGG